MLLRVDLAPAITAQNPTPSGITGLACVDDGCLFAPIAPAIAAIALSLMDRGLTTPAGDVSPSGLWTPDPVGRRMVGFRSAKVR